MNDDKQLVVKINVKAIDKDFDYIFFSRAYLMLAYSGLKNRKQSLAKEVVYDSAKDNNYIIAPILYSIKHAIELFIKFVSKVLEINDSDFERSHDIKKLFFKLNKTLKNKNITKNIVKLEELIIKYHQNKFLNGKLINSFVMIDEQNDVFRYPDNKAKLDLNFENIFYKFTESDFKNIRKDIKEFYDLFYNIGTEVLKNTKKYEQSNKNNNL